MGKYKRYCKNCGRWFDSDDTEFKACPICGGFVRAVKCNRCNYEWTPHKGTYPKTCANLSCKSPYYNQERSEKFEHLRKERKQ